MMTTTTGDDEGGGGGGGKGETVVTRTGDELVVRCRDSRETWYLTCSGNRWLGDIYNCTTTSQRSSHRSGTSSTGIPFPQGLVIAVVLGLILGLIVGSASLALLFVLRRRNHSGSAAEDQYAAEKLQGGGVTDNAGDFPCSGYRSTTCSGYIHTGSDLTETVDLVRSPRCFAFYSGLRGSSTAAADGARFTSCTGIPLQSDSTTAGSALSPIRTFSSNPESPGGCVRTQSQTYEKTTKTGVAGGTHDPNLYFELDPQRKNFGQP